MAGQSVAMALVHCGRPRSLDHDIEARCLSRAEAWVLLILVGISLLFCCLALALSLMRCTFIAHWSLYGGAAVEILIFVSVDEAASVTSALY